MQIFVETRIDVKVKNFIKEELNKLTCLSSIKINYGYMYFFSVVIFRFIYLYFQEFEFIMSSGVYILHVKEDNDVKVYQINHDRLQ